MTPMKLPIESKKAILALLAELQNADKEQSLKETSYILHVAQELGLEVSDVRDVLKHPKQFKFSPPADEGGRMTILYYLLFFMNIDGQIKEEEEIAVKKMGFRLGFRPELTSELISIIKQHLDEKVPPQDLLDKIRAYLN